HESKDTKKNEPQMDTQINTDDFGLCFSCQRSKFCDVWKEFSHKGHEEHKGNSVISYVFWSWPKPRRVIRLTGEISASSALCAFPTPFFERFAGTTNT